VRTLEKGGGEASLMGKYGVHLFWVRHLSCRAAEFILEFVPTNANKRQPDMIEDLLCDGSVDGWDISLFKIVNCMQLLWMWTKARP
jgi:hypothetical protein